MKKIVAIIAFALMSVVAFGQVDIYFEDIDMGFHVEKGRISRCDNKDFFTDEYVDPVAKAIFDTLVVHYKSFSFYRDYKYGVPKKEFEWASYGAYEYQFLTELLGELHRRLKEYDRMATLSIYRETEKKYEDLFNKYKKIHEYFYELRKPYQEIEERIERERLEKLAAERKAREQEKVEKEFKSISFSLNK